MKIFKFLPNSSRQKNILPEQLPSLKVLILITTSFLMMGCGSFDEKLNTDTLSDQCKNQLIQNEFLVKFKNEDHYRTVWAQNSEEFLNEVVRPMKDQVQDYGLNFKFQQHSTHSRHSRHSRHPQHPQHPQKAFGFTNTSIETKTSMPKATRQPWVKSSTRSAFLIDQGYRGQGVRIAVLDTGIDLSHRAFKNQLVASGYNMAEDNEDVQDFNGHGTIVSSLISSAEAKSIDGLNFEGGLACQAELLPIKIFPQAERTTDLTTIIKALDFAIEQDVDIINASWGGSDNCSAILENKLFDVWAHNILFVTSAGDDSKNLTYQPDYPASFAIPSMIVTSAINKQFEIPTRANIGGTINLFAPGQDVPVLGLNGSLVIESGTSLAAAIATGGAALLRSAFPDIALHTWAYALSHGSSLENPHQEQNILDLKSSYLYLQSRQISPRPLP